MTNINFIVDQDKCIHCGKCSVDCVADIIKMNAQKLPVIPQSEQNKCIKCQHCLAICPVGAISILDKKPENSELCNNFPNPDQLENIIKSRRSFRNYKKENLPPDLMEKLKSILKYTPTGCNYHRLHFSIIDDIEVMDRFRNRTNNTIKKLLLSVGNNFITEKFNGYRTAFLQGEDVIFRGAPHMIVVSSPISAPCANEDGIIALSNFELYAQSLGIGTLWCGFAQICLKAFPELCEFLEIPDNYKPVYVMLFGATDTKYIRTTQPAEYVITKVSGKGNPENIPLSRKLKRYFWNSIR